MSDKSNMQLNTSSHTQNAGQAADSGATKPSLGLWLEVRFERWREPRKVAGVEPGVGEIVDEYVVIL